MSSLKKQMNFDKIGIIAGKGDFPLLIIKEIKKSNNTAIYAAGFKNITEHSICNMVEKFCWLNLGLLEPIISFFKKYDVKKIIMAGLIKHKFIFDNLKLDRTAKKVFSRIKDNRADSILGEIAEEFSRNGIDVIPAIEIMKEHVADKFLMAGERPDIQEMEDIEFGFSVAKHIAQFDIGQTVIIKNKAIIAVEAMEGTDKCILRAGRLAGEGTVVVKVSKPAQDWRFDIPVIGRKTIRIMEKAGAKILAVEARKTIMLEKNKILRDAERSGIIVFGV